MYQERLVSIIVPVYNVQSYLKNCIESILAQTYTMLEVILVDDGSSDMSGIICDEYQKMDSRISVIHKENGGLSDARNCGIEIATGSFLMFIDSDDIVSIDTVERMVSASQVYNCQIAICNMVRVYANGSMEPFYHPTDSLCVLRGAEKFETLKQPSVCNKLFAASLFNDLRFPKGKYYEDTFVYHVLADRARGIVLTGHNGYYYLVREGSILLSENYADRIFDFAEAVYERMCYLTKKNVTRYSAEACLSMYAVTADILKKVSRTKSNEESFSKLKMWYRYAFKFAMFNRELNIKNKIRMTLLYLWPNLHGFLF